VENLFDTIDDPAVNDSEFLPDSKKQWNTAKYNQKIHNLARVIAAIDTTGLPAIVGLTEVENRGVLKDLVASEHLKKARYQIIHEESCDPRGIDAALIYRPDVFRRISHEKVPVYYSASRTRSTRELLYVCGVVLPDDTLHMVVNHWKSRIGGTKQTESKRIAYARAVREIVDSLFRVRPDANILLMGDFNDNPEDSSVSKVLSALDPGTGNIPRELYNLSYGPRMRGEGTLFYNGWELYDQIIVSSALLSKDNSGLYSAKEMSVFKEDWILYRNKTGVMVPDRSYRSDMYYGGYSDHLPVWIRLQRKGN
jgi:endonuclease/exonuclease/phosphatase family metal-dependent hydrolase